MVLCSFSEESELFEEEKRYGAMERYVRIDAYGNRYFAMFALFEELCIRGNALPLRYLLPMQNR